MGELMMAYIFVKYLHLVGILVLFSALVLEHVLIKPTMSPKELARVSAVDLVYGVAASLVLGAGLLLWFLVGKGSDFYSSNPLFHIKLGLFFLVGLISIYPTLFFLKNRKSNESEVAIPKSIIMIVRFELLMILMLPLLALFMANGIGLA